MAKDMESWLGAELVIQVPGVEYSGTIRYGVLSSNPEGFHDCPAGSRKVVEGQEPAYWFRSWDMTRSIRLKTRAVRKNSITGVGEGLAIGSFKYTIKRDPEE